MNMTTSALPDLDIDTLEAIDMARKSMRDLAGADFGGFDDPHKAHARDLVSIAAAALDKLHKLASGEDAHDADLESAEDEDDGPRHAID
jgi:hypothetical protein